MSDGHSYILWPEHPGCSASETQDDSQVGKLIAATLEADVHSGQPEAGRYLRTSEFIELVIRGWVGKRYPVERSRGKNAKYTELT